MMYEWEATDEPYYFNGVLAERAMGKHYDALCVEQTVEGWHGVLLAYVPDDDYLGGLEMLDEEVFASKYEAVAWCERADSSHPDLKFDFDDNDWERILEEEGLGLL